MTRRKGVTERERLAYEAGFIDALSTWAYWKNGQQYVGTSGVTLEYAITHRRDAVFYAPRIGTEIEP